MLLQLLLPLLPDRWTACLAGWLANWPPPLQCTVSQASPLPGQLPKERQKQQQQQKQQQKQQIIHAIIVCQLRLHWSYTPGEYLLSNSISLTSSSASGHHRKIMFTTSGLPTTAATAKRTWTPQSGTASIACLHIPRVVKRVIERN